ncbi:hypothetical protein [Mesorhizobium sp. M0296]|uniref:hypothetical protein n=1 Tax=Mesorhizobium sp. M0296 TaxID=2956931 RepID=UPI00333D8A65
MKAKSLLAIVLTTLLGSTGAQASQFEVWMRGFIPNKHDTNPGYVTLVPNHENLTMIPGPVPLVSDCFLTDQREFSNNPNDSSRVAAYAKYDDAGNLIDKKFIESQSVEVDCDDGDEECRKTVDTSAGEIGPVALDDGKLRISMIGKASDACFTGAPNLDFNMIFEINVSARTITYFGAVDDFPSFEALFKVDDQPIVTLFRIPPAVGSSAFGVLGTRTLESKTINF